MCKFCTLPAVADISQVDHYNLDVIISVGYRVKSTRGIQFRDWATRVLREHLLRGYTLNERRLAERGLQESAAGGRAAGAHADEARRSSRTTGRAVLEVVQRLRRHLAAAARVRRRPAGGAAGRPAVVGGAGSRSTRARAIAAFERELLARNEASSALRPGARRGAGRESSAPSSRPFGGSRSTRAREARAAHLLYFVIKDHPFSDGNKRIGTLLFSRYLRQERRCARPGTRDGAWWRSRCSSPRATSEQKDLMIRLV